MYSKYVESLCIFFISQSFSACGINTFIEHKIILKLHDVKLRINLKLVKRKKYLPEKSKSLGIKIYVNDCVIFIKTLKALFQTKHNACLDLSSNNVISLWNV